MIVKEHKTRDRRLILSICDKEIIGKEFCEGRKRLFADPKFYGWEEKSEEEIIKLAKRAQIINLLGEKSVKLFIKEGIIDKKNIIRIKGVPHAQCVIVEE